MRINIHDIPTYTPIAYTLGRGGATGMRDNPHELIEFKLIVHEFYTLQKFKDVFLLQEMLEHESGDLDLPY